MRLVGIGVGVLLLGLGCMGEDAAEQGLAPTGSASPVLDLRAVAGRWEARSEQGGQAVILVPCAGENPFVEVRTDGEGGWELLASRDDGLQILPVTTVEPTEGGVRIGVDGAGPVTVTWVEPERTATFAPLFGEQRFVAPAHRAELPRVTQPASECPVPQEEP